MRTVDFGEEEGVFTEIVFCAAQAAIRARALYRSAEGFRHPKAWPGRRKAGTTGVTGGTGKHREIFNYVQPV